MILCVNAVSAKTVEKYLMEWTLLLCISFRLDHCVSKVHTSYAEMTDIRLKG